MDEEGLYFSVMECHIKVSGASLQISSSHKWQHGDGHDGLVCHLWGHHTCLMILSTTSVGCGSVGHSSLDFPKTSPWSSSTFVIMALSVWEGCHHSCWILGQAASWSHKYLVSFQRMWLYLYSLPSPVRCMLHIQMQVREQQGPQQCDRSDHIPYNEYASYHNMQVLIIEASSGFSLTWAW